MTLLTLLKLTDPDVAQTLQVTAKIVHSDSSMSGMTTLGSKPFRVDVQSSSGPKPGIMNVTALPGTTHLFKAYTFTAGWAWIRNIGPYNLKWGWLNLPLDLKEIAMLKPGETMMFRMLPTATNIAGGGDGGVTQIESMVWEE